MLRKTVQLALLIICTVMSQPTVMAQSPFHGPVPHDHWASVAVEDLIQKGILEGYPDGFFRGRRPLTRHEFAIAIDRLLDKLLSIQAKERAEKEREARLLKLAPNFYEPVPKDHWAYPTLIDLKRAGLFRRYDIQGFENRSERSRYSFATLLRENRQSLMQPFVDNQLLLTPRVKELLTKLEQEFQAEISALEQVEKQ